MLEKKTAKRKQRPVFFSRFFSADARSISSFGAAVEAVAFRFDHIPLPRRIIEVETYEMMQLESGTCPLTR